jgi:probable HAF family extracellular repeat protein
LKRALLLACALICLIPSANSQTYSILDLGALQPAAINSFAQVAGTMNGEAYLWSPFQTPKSLGILPGGTASSALGLNDRGVVVGIADGPVTVDGPDGPFTCTDALQGFEWTSGGGLQGMGLMVLGDTNPCEGTGGYTNMYPFANAVNDLNQVVGTINWSGFTYVDGFSWKNSTAGMTVLPFPTGLDLVYPLTVTNAINNRNQMVGAVGCCTDLAEGHALYWNHKVISDLGTLGGPDTDFDSYCSNARGINDLDQVVGWSTTIAASDFPCGEAISESPHAFFWTEAHGMQDLGTLPGDTMSMAYAINFFGQVIGTSGNNTMEPAFGGTQYSGVEYGGVMSLEVVGHPFLWTQRDGMKDLNALIPSTSGWVLNTATGINAWGQIVGSGVHNGETHGFLLTPRLRAENPLPASAIVPQLNLR